MSIPEKQLETWSHQGSMAQSAATYQAIKAALEDPKAPYASRSFEVFLQGSYGNDTNIYSDSDVDIVICLTTTYYADLSNLSEADKAVYERSRLPAQYAFVDFKKEVAAWLVHNFGTGVKEGNKAIYVPGNGSRRDSDVLVCAEHRQYRSYSVPYSSDFNGGICFWTKDGKYIVNFPKQHSANCTQKHQATSQWLKPNVRMLKNMRNAMIQVGLLTDGQAPSYFLEGMLWNVPNANFGKSYQACFENTHTRLSNCESAQLTCANGLHWLLRDDRPVCWNERDFRSFLDASARYWNSQ